MIEISSYSDIGDATKDLLDLAGKAIAAKKTLYMALSTNKRMTKKQRGSLHLWCEGVAEALNDAGLYCAYKPIFSGDEEYIERPWTKELVKENIYKPTLEKFTSKLSTEDQSTTDPREIVESIVKYFAEKGVVLPGWPSLR